MTIISKTSKEDTQHRIDSGLLWHIKMTGHELGENSRANKYREQDLWRERVKRMCENLRAEGYADEARDLKANVDYCEHVNTRKLYVTVAPEVWHIFTYALRKLPDGDRLYGRIMARRYVHDAGWL